MLQIVFAGPPAGALLLVDALGVAGFPARVDDQRGGFPPEDGIEWVEAVAGSADYLAEVTAIAERFGFVLRLHSWIEAPAQAVLL